MDKKFLGDFRRPRLDPEIEALHKRFTDTVSLVRDKTEQMKEAIIRRALGPDAPADHELRGRMRIEVEMPGGIERVLLDDRLLVVFQPGYLNTESGQWTVPYAIAEPRP